MEATLAAPNSGRSPTRRRAWILGSILLLASFVACGGLLEWIALQVFPDSDQSTLPCMVLDNPATGVTGRPGMSCRQKLLEADLVDYRFNRCGHRSDHRCHLDGPAQVDRVVMIGSSQVEGVGVTVESTFAKRLEQRLSQSLGRPIDVYNEGMQWGTPRSIASRLDDIVAEKPRMVLWPVTPFDVQNAALLLPYIPGRKLEDSGAAGTPPVLAPEPRNFRERLLFSYRKRGGLPGMWGAGVDRVMGPLRESRAVYLAQHLLFLNQSVFVKHFAANPVEANYMLVDASGRIGLSTEPFETYYQRISTRLGAAGIPLVVTLLPSHAQLGLLSGAAENPDDRLAPHALNTQLEAIVRRHGDAYLDIFDRFQGLQGDPGGYFFAVDQHMADAGHALIGRVLGEALVQDAATRTLLSGRPGGAASGAN